MLHQRIALDTATSDTTNMYTQRSVDHTTSIVHPDIFELNEGHATTDKIKIVAGMVHIISCKDNNKTMPKILSNEIGPPP